MVKPAAGLGWQPDPTGRYEYRYWDGTDWCADVFDDGLMFRDPFGLGSMPPPRRGTTRRWGPRVIGSGVLAAGVAASVAFAVVPGTGGDNTETTGQAQPDLTTTSVAESSTTSGSSSTSGSPGAAPGAGVTPGLGGVPTPGASSSTTATTAPAAGEAPAGDADVQALVDSITQGMLASGGGMLAPEQAECFAQGLVDALGPARIRELGLEDGNVMTMGTAMANMTAEESAALSQTNVTCAPTTQG
jgi:hypothetical protein